MFQVDPSLAGKTRQAFEKAVITFGENCAVEGGRLNVEGAVCEGMMINSVGPPVPEAVKGTARGLDPAFTGGANVKQHHSGVTIYTKLEFIMLKGGKEEISGVVRHILHQPDDDDFSAIDDLVKINAKAMAAQ
jgi:hypothetical protein